jgi:large subunit ribosomal protein L10
LRIPQVTAALTRQKKEQIVSEITGKLENSVIVFGLRFKGLDVSAAAGVVAFQSIRASTSSNWPAGTALGGGNRLCCCRCCCTAATTAVQVQTLQKFRRGVPENSSVYVCKNSLMREATKKVPGWETLADTGCNVSFCVGVW